MLNMQVFYRKMQFAAPETPDSRSSALVGLTRLDVDRMKSLASDLWWADWSSPVSEPVAN